MAIPIQDRLRQHTMIRRAREGYVGIPLTIRSVAALYGTYGISIPSWVIDELINDESPADIDLTPFAESVSIDHGSC